MFLFSLEHTIAIRPFQAGERGVLNSTQRAPNTQTFHTYFKFFPIVFFFIFFDYDDRWC